MYATIREQTLQRISEIIESPTPAYEVNGQTVTWAFYLDQLRRIVAWCDKTLEQNTPVEILSQGSC
jgi:hypothetical protein